MINYFSLYDKRLNVYCKPFEANDIFQAKIMVKNALLTEKDENIFNHMVNDCVLADVGSFDSESGLFRCDGSGIHISVDFIASEAGISFVPFADLPNFDNNNLNNYISEITNLHAVIDGGDSNA